jgi:hypothetical protein
MFNLLLQDPDISADFDPTLAKLDNYQIYSFVLFDQAWEKITTDYFNGRYRADQYGYFSELVNPDPAWEGVYGTFDTASSSSYSWFWPAPVSDLSQPRSYAESENYTVEATTAIAYQSFSPAGKINYDFANIATAYPIKGNRRKNHIYHQETEQQGLQGSGEAPYPNVTCLFLGFLTDQRIRPNNPRPVATSTRIIKYGYYRRNLAEAHPRILATLDWFSGSISVTKGKPYTLPVVDPVLGTLLVDAVTAGEISALLTPPNSYPLTALLPDAIVGLFEYWESIRPATTGKPADLDYLSDFYTRVIRQGIDTERWVIHKGLPSDSPLTQSQQNLITVGNQEYRGHLEQVLGADGLPTRDEFDNIILVYKPTKAYNSLPGGSIVWKAIFREIHWIPVSTRARVIGATNNRWDFGTVTSSADPPDPTHQIFNFDELELFEDLQSDGSYGTLMMDSPRILELHAALDAGKYANDPLTGDVRTANLGHMIERSTNLLGYRPEPDGTIDQEKETTIYQRSVLKDYAVLTPGDYKAGRFGKRGLLVRRLPNKKTATGYEPGGIVAVHDIPQMIAEFQDQLNQALNIQESTSIQIRDGDKVYTYPNQLALLIEIATKVIPQQRQIREIWTSAVVTQLSINEVIAGIGLPTVAKSLVINGQQLPWFGIQPNRSLELSIATVAHGVGIVKGQLL